MTFPNLPQKEHDERIRTRLSQVRCIASELLEYGQLLDEIAQDLGKRTGVMTEKDDPQFEEHSLSEP